MSSKITHLNGDDDKLQKLLETRLEIPFQVPHLLTPWFDDVYVVHGEDGALIVSSKRDVTQIVRPLGAYSPDMLQEAFIKGLVQKKVFLDGWKEGADLESCISELMLGLDAVEDISRVDLTFLYHNPMTFPDNVVGRHYQSLRTALNRMKNNGLSVRRLNAEDFAEILVVTSSWFENKIAKGQFKGIRNQYQHTPLYKEIITAFSPESTGQDIQSYGIFAKDEELLAFQIYMRFRNKVVPIARMSKPNRDSAQECLEMHMLRKWKREGVTQVFRGAEGYQPKSLRGYNSKFCPQYTIPTIRYVISPKP